MCYTNKPRCSLSSLSPSRTTQIQLLMFILACNCRPTMATDPSAHPGNADLSSTFGSLNISASAGVHAGNSVTHIHAPPATVKPAPRSLLPFGRDKNFIGREKEAEKLWTILGNDTQSHKTAALQGLEGIGKSQIAIKFGHAYQQKHPITGYFGCTLAVDPDSKGPILILRLRQRSLAKARAHRIS